MDDLRQAAEMALEALEKINKLSVGERAVCLPAEIDGAMESLRQALNATPRCKTHPDAPHGFDRNGSHNADRYVCECEGWEPPKQEPVGYAHVEDLKRKHHDFYVNREQGINEVPLYAAPPHKRSIAEDVGRLLNSGKGFYDDGTPIDPKAIQLRMEGIGDGVVTFTEVLIPRPPKQWVGLEAEEVGALTVFDGLFYAETPLLADFVRAIEAKLKEKNT